MNKDIKESIQDLDNSIENLKNIVAMPEIANDVIMISSIKTFELSFELFWKTLRKKLNKEYRIQTYGAMQTLQEAYGLKLIDNEKLWIDMLDDRNLGVHIYKRVLAHEIFERVKKNYTPFLRSEFEKCFRN
jgi:nucleotidyltransferase substrate binding protein (TIGR01987 family)